MKALLPLLIISILFSCGIGDPQDPQNPEPEGYNINCPDEISSKCNIEGTYYEVNPLFHPNNFDSWTFSDERIGSPYYHWTISEVSSNCDKIILRGKTGVVQREISIVGLNDTMLVIKDPLIRPDNIVLIRSQGGRFKDFNCSSICTKGCHNETDIVRDLCKCEEFEHGNQCVLTSSLVDFSSNDYLYEAFEYNNSVITLTSDFVNSEGLIDIYASSIFPNGEINWSLKMPDIKANQYLGYHQFGNSVIFYFSYLDPIKNKKDLLQWNVSMSGNSQSTNKIELNYHNNYEHLFTIIKQNNIYIIGHTREGISSNISNLNIVKFNEVGTLVNSRKHENSQYSRFTNSCVGGYDNQSNLLILLNHIDLVKIDPISLQIDQEISNYGDRSNRVVVMSDDANATEYYDASRSLTSEDILQQPDQVLTYLHSFKIFNSDHTQLKYLWTPGLFDYSPFDLETKLFKDKDDRYFYLGTIQNTLKFGKYRSSLSQLEYNYTYPYKTRINNVFPIQLKNGEYLFVCNTQRFGSNRDVLMVNFNENGLYNYTSCN